MEKLKEDQKLQLEDGSWVETETGDALKEVASKRKLKEDEDSKQIIIANAKEELKKARATGDKKSVAKIKDQLSNALDERWTEFDYQNDEAIISVDDLDEKFWGELPLNYIDSLDWAKTHRDLLEIQIGKANYGRDEFGNLLVETQMTEFRRILNNIIKQSPSIKLDQKY